MTNTAELHHFTNTNHQISFVSHPDEQIEAKLVCNEAELLSLENFWRKLEETCPHPTLFQSFDWCRNYLLFANETTKGQVEGLDPCIVTIWQQSVLVGLLPMCIQKKHGLKFVTGMTEPFQQYTELLLAPTITPLQIRRPLIGALKSIRADYMHFGQVRMEGPLAKTLGEYASRSGGKDAAPFVNLQQWNDFESYLKSIKAKTRKNMRNARNRLEKTAAVTHKLAEYEAQVAGVICRAFTGREAWLEQLGITSRAFREANFQEFLKRFSDSEKTGIEVLAMTLFHGHTAMADQWGFVYRGRYYAFMATWNEKYEASSPGKMHLGEVIKTCYEQEIRIADFMIPAASYKRTWAADASPVCDYVMPMSLRGSIHVLLWLRFLRPLAKNMIAKLPNGLRGFLVRKILPTVE